MKLKIMVMLLLSSTLTYGQTITGRILEKTDHGEEPIVGAVVRWFSKPTLATFTDDGGTFSIQNAGQQQQLILSFVGYKSDTVMAHGPGPHTFYLNSGTVLAEAVVKGGTTVIDRMATVQTELITSKELAKAACCNLSESFETNASVSVSYADAITGARQLQMLGLSGQYVQTNIENMPGIRGLSVPFGLSYVPGTWIQSIDVSKGTSSVINGYESMVGALNVELQKPDLAERLYINAYVNEVGRTELNLNLAHKINDQWSVGLLTHGSMLKSELDRNGDGFRDLPKYDQVNVLNRWKYGGERFMGQFGINYLKENRAGGQNGFESLTETPNLYGFTNKTEKLTFFTKTAVLFPETPYRGLGLITNTSFLKSNSSFGYNPYDAKQNTFYGNLVYQDILGSTQHTYKTGLSFLADYYDENLVNFDETIKLNRQELVPGAFLEYTLNLLDRTVLVAGVRLDQHNLFGTQVTPRLHFKQVLGQNSTWRLSAGKGFRIPTPLAENYGKLVSSRKVVLNNEIAPEVSWSYGASWSQDFGRNTFVVDVFHTEFSAQQILDMEQPGYLHFYNSEERSFATGTQAELKLVPNDRWSFKVAQRFSNVKQTLGQGTELVLADKMFVANSMSLINVAYAAAYDKWKTDFTWHYMGKQRIPNGIGIEANKSASYVSGFARVNAQVSRNFVDWEYYLGAENLLDFKQDNPILGVDNPFGSTFDAGQVWGPVLGRTVYLGIRYRLR